MTTPDRCVAIVEKLLELANKGDKIILEKDWGGNTLTIYFNDDYIKHTHVGVPGGNFNILVRDLSGVLSSVEPKDE